MGRYYNFTGNTFDDGFLARARKNADNFFRLFKNSETKSVAGGGGYVISLTIRVGDFFREIKRLWADILRRVLLTYYTTH